MKILPIFILIAGFCINAAAQNCLESAKIVAPVLSDNARKVFDEKLVEAQTNFAKEQTADNFIRLGRRKAYLGNYKEAIKVFTDGIAKFPKDARLYRHRGHRLLTIRCFDDAIKDFKTAEKLVKGKRDEIEPDGLPNARNTPVSTLQSNIFYHLGLAHYVKGDFKNALKAYRKAEKISTNPDMLVATKNWLYMTLRRLGKTKEAQESITDIKDNLDLIENDDYYKFIKLYQGKLKPEDLIKPDESGLFEASRGYGAGNWFLYTGEKEKALKIFRQITAGNEWASFAYIAAEADLRNLNKAKF